MDDSFWHRVERARKRTSEERFLDTLEMIDLSRELMKAGVRMQFPEADEKQVKEILRHRLHLVRTVEDSR